MWKVRPPTELLKKKKGNTCENECRLSARRAEDFNNSDQWGKTGAEWSIDRFAIPSRRRDGERIRHSVQKTYQHPPSPSSPNLFHNFTCLMKPLPTDGRMDGPTDGYTLLCIRGSRLASNKSFLRRFVTNNLGHSGVYLDSNRISTIPSKAFAAIKDGTSQVVRTIKIDLSNNTIQYIASGNNNQIGLWTPLPCLSVRPFDRPSVRNDWLKGKQARTRRQTTFFVLFKLIPFLDASSHLYIPSCLSVRPSVRPSQSTSKNMRNKAFRSQI